MKKNRHIWLLTLAGLLPAACQEEMARPDGSGYSTEAILFTSPYTVSRSPEMRYGAFKEDDAVGVLGYCKATGPGGQDYSASPWNTKKEFAMPDVFYNQMLRYEGEGTWTYAWNGSGNVGGLHPWLENESYTYAFFAYYPYAEVRKWGATNYSGVISVDGKNMGTIALSDMSVNGDPTITYTLPHNGYSATGSGLKWDVVPDLMLAYQIDHRKADGAVSLAFRHMLCAFEFEVNNYNETPVTIQSLRFEGNDFYKSLSVTGQEQDYTIGTDRYSGYFDLLDVPIECPAATEVDGVVTPTTVKLTMDGTAAGDPIDLLFVPDKEGKITEGTCAVEVNIGGNETRQNVKDGMSFSPGVRSIFSINIIGDNFVIQVRSDDRWEDDGDSEIIFD